MCEACFKTRAKLGICLGCKQAWYCSPECQKRAWKTHRNCCKLAARIKGECRDNTLGDKAVVFPILFNSVLQVRPRCLSTLSTLMFRKQILNNLLTCDHLQPHE